MSLSPAAAPSGRWQRRKQARPAEILNAALALFVERGFSATRLEVVAQRAGISKATLYLYFDGKDALFRAVLQEFVVPELERFEEIARQHSGSSEALVRALVHHWWRAVGATPLAGIAKLIVSEAGNFPELAAFFVERVVRRARRLFAGVLRRGMERGEFRACNATYAARVLLAPLVFAAIYDRSLRPFDRDAYRPDAFVNEHLDIFLRGMAAGIEPGTRHTS